MITIGANGQKISYGIKHYNLDTAADLEKLNPAGEQMGTTCFIIDKSKYYMINGQKEWIEIAPLGKLISSESGGGNFPGEDEDGDGYIDIIYDGGVIK